LEIAHDLHYLDRMCGLYSFKKSAEETRSLFQYLDEPEFPPRATVAPGSPIAIVRMERGERRFALVRWGLIPSWVKEVKPGRPLINARSETVLEKPSFRNAMKRRRCLIPADGYYEWTGTVAGRKQPYLIHRAGHGLFGFAGVWEHWMGADGSELETACIVTAAANHTVAAVHDRMPVVIPPERFGAWLDCDEVEAKEAALLLGPAPEEYFIYEPTTIARRAPPPKPVAPPQMKLF
jgi:putative SOS response-associated peptidase YedK